MRHTLRDLHRLETHYTLHDRGDGVVVLVEEVFVPRTKIPPVHIRRELDVRCIDEKIALLTKIRAQLIQ